MLTTHGAGDAGGTLDCVRGGYEWLVLPLVMVVVLSLLLVVVPVVLSSSMLVVISPPVVVGVGVEGGVKG